MTDTQGEGPATSVAGTEAIDDRIVEKEAGLIRRLVTRSRAPWLTLGIGFVMTLVGLPLAWAAFVRLLSPTTTVPFLAQLAASLIGSEVSSGGGGWMLKLIILAVGLAAAGIGLVTIVASVSVLLRRGARHAVHGSKRAAALAKEHDLKGKVGAGAAKIADGTRDAASIVRETDVTDRARETLNSGNEVIRKRGKEIRGVIKSRYEQMRSGEEAVEGDLLEPGSGPDLRLPSHAEGSDETDPRPPAPPRREAESGDIPRIEIRRDDSSR